MAIIYTYPQINSSSDLAASDLMIISDMSANGRPTKSLTLKNLADFITTTGTGTGTTNAIIKWADGPGGLLGDSIMNEDVDKINLNGILSIAESNNQRLEVKFGTDSSLTHDNTPGANNNLIIGRAGDLIIRNRARTRDILFQADNGEFDGNVDTYFRLDGSMADIGNSDYYTRWGDNSHIVLGNSANTNNLDFDMYHDGSDTYLINGSSSLYVESKGGISIENKSGGSGDIDIIQSVTNADVNISAYNGTYFKADTSAGATIFSKPVEVPLVPAANANAASKQYVDQQIASIPAGLVFQGNWDANTNTPALASGVGTVGNYYVVSVAGNTNLDGITDWEVGDWAVFVEVGGVDKWDKIDQTFVQGSGATGQVTFWNSINAVTGDNDFYWDNVNKRLGIGTTTPDVRLHVDPTLKIGDRLGTDGSLIIQSQQGPNITFTSSGDSLIVSGSTGSPNGNTISLVDEIKTLRFDNGIGGTISIERGNRGLMDSNIGGYEVQQQNTTSSNGKSTFLSTDTGGTILRSTSYGGTGTSADIQFQFGGGDNAGEPAPTTKMIIKNDGDVGIGTTSPSKKLEIKTTTTNDGLLLSTGPPDDLNYADIFNSNSNSFPVGNISLSYGSSLTALINAQSNSMLLRGGSNATGYIRFNSFTTEVMRMTNVGLGIGTTTPAAALDVIGRIGLDDGNLNVSVGDAAGDAITTGTRNVSVGVSAGTQLSTGSDNILIGQSSGSASTSSNKNVGIGPYSLQSLSYSGDSHNVAVGYHAGRLITTGRQNTILGGLAGDVLTVGERNTVLGYSALSTEDTGSHNTAIGYRALSQLNYAGNGYNTALGSDAGRRVSTGFQNTIVGGLAADSLTTGAGNVAIGYNSLSTEDSGGRNVAVGWGTLTNLDAGSNAYNVAIGYNAANGMTTALQSVTIGGFAGDAINTGEFNTAVGYNSLSTATTAGRNVAMGWSSLRDVNGAGSRYNSALGFSSGENITSGVQNTIVGGLAGTTIIDGDNLTVLGYNAEPSASNATDEVTLGDSGVSTLRCAVTTITAISDERDKTNIEELPYGLDFVDSLKPKKFVWDHRPEIKKEVDAEGNETEVEFYSSRKGSKDIGFIAQELDQIDDEYTRLVYKSNPDKLEASYGRLIPILVKAIQELSAEVKMLKNK